MTTISIFQENSFKEKTSDTSNTKKSKRNLPGYDVITYENAIALIREIAQETFKPFNLVEAGEDNPISTILLKLSTGSKKSGINDIEALRSEESNAFNQIQEDFQQSRARILETSGRTTLKDEESNNLSQPQANTTSTKEAEKTSQYDSQPQQVIDNQSFIKETRGSFECWFPKPSKQSSKSENAKDSSQIVDDICKQSPESTNTNNSGINTESLTTFNSLLEHFRSIEEKKETEKYKTEVETSKTTQRQILIQEYEQSVTELKKNEQQEKHETTVQTSFLGKVQFALLEPLFILLSKI